MNPATFSKLFNSFLWSLSPWFTFLNLGRVLSESTARMKGYEPYLNTSICLVTIPATALVYEDGVRLAAGWPSPMPTLVPANAPCFSVRAAMPSTSPEPPALATPSPYNPAAGDMEFGPCGFYYCQLPNWGGACYHQAVQSPELNVCMVLSDWQSRFSAIGPDYNTVIDLYWDTACQDLGMPNVVYPGFGNLSLIGMDKEVKSVFVKRKGRHIESS